MDGKTYYIVKVIDEDIITGMEAIPNKDGGSFISVSSSEYDALDNIYKKYKKVLNNIIII